MPQPRRKLPGLVGELSHTDFENKELLGEGSFGKVYKAAYKKTGDIYAIKVVSKDRMKNGNYLKQIRNEIMIMEKLDHPNIVKLVTFHESDTFIYLVLELGGVISDYPEKPLRGTPQRQKVQRV